MGSELRRHVGHLPLGTVELLWIGGESRNDVPLPVAIEINVQRAFVVGDRCALMASPRLAGILGVLKPPGRSAGEVHHHQVGPAVAIEIVGEIAE